MFKKILGAVILVLVVLLVLASLRPDTFSVSRSVTINATAPTVFMQVNNLRQWEPWSPWEKLDPAMKKSYEGSLEGSGAIYRWAGNNQVGEGSTTILESVPYELIKIKLEMLKPFACVNDVQFNFKSQGYQTEVTWSMSGKNNFMAKVMDLVVGMDKMVGGQFEQGLSQLKNVVENQNK